MSYNARAIRERRGLTQQAVADRLDAIGLTNPDAVDTALAATLDAENATGNWHTHYRTWRRHRLRKIEQHYSARLDDIADVATKIRTLGPPRTS